MRQALKTLASDRRGVIIVMFALMLPILLGFVGLGVEVAYWFQNHRSLQAAADAAAIAGSYEVYESRPTQTGTIATREATNNGWSSTDGTITINNSQLNGIFPTGTYSTDYSADTAAVEVIMTLDVARMFSGWFTAGNVTINAVAVATTTSSGSACILSLNPSAAGAITVSGNITMTMDCGLAVSSTDPIALDLPGNSIFDVNEICVAGGTNVGGSIRFDDASPTNNCTPPSDPLSGLARPTDADAACDFPTVYDIPSTVSPDTPGGTTYTLSSGVYCGGIKISGSGNTINFNPGTYIIAGGDGFQISGSGNTINATGVTFFNTDNQGDNTYKKVDLSGGNTFDISAPTSGDFAGVLFYHDPDDGSPSSDNQFSISGNNTFTNFDGVVYFPDHNISISGNSTSVSTCGPKFLSDTLSISGNIQVFGGGTNCAGNNVNIGNSVTVGLVE